MGENRFDDMFGDADKAFDQQYPQALAELKGLTAEQLKAITPEGTDSEVYQKLIAVVQKAESDNLKQADLINNIKALGDVAVKIAKKVPAFAALL